MYARNENQQAEKSRLGIRDALLSLMERCPYADISITQICREAQVVRQTYYRNFDFKEDILAFHLDSLFHEYIQTLFRGQTEDTYGQLMAFFSFMLRQAAVLRLLSQNNLFSLLNRTITENVPRFIGVDQIALVEEQRTEPYITCFIAATICALLAQWVDNGFAESPVWMARLATRLLAGLRQSAPAAQP